MEGGEEGGVGERDILLSCISNLSLKAHMKACLLVISSVFARSFQRGLQGCQCGHT